MMVLPWRNADLSRTHVSFNLKLSKDGLSKIAMSKIISSKFISSTANAYETHSESAWFFLVSRPLWGLLKTTQQVGRSYFFEVMSAFHFFGTHDPNPLCHALLGSGKHHWTLGCLFGTDQLGSSLGAPNSCLEELPGPEAAPPESCGTELRGSRRITHIYIYIVK